MAVYRRKTLGAGLIALAFVPALIVGTGLYYDGLLSFLDWPEIFNWMTAYVILSVGCGWVLLTTPLQARSTVVFRKGGFDVNRRPLLRAVHTQSIDWEAIDRLVLWREHPNISSISVHLRTEQRVGLNLRLLGLKEEKTLSRLYTSAQEAGFDFSVPRKAKFLIWTCEVWDVVLKDSRAEKGT